MNKSLLRVVLAVVLFAAAIGLAATAVKYQRLIAGVDYLQSQETPLSAASPEWLLPGYYGMRAAIPWLWLGAAVSGVSSAGVALGFRRRLFVVLALMALLVLPVMVEVKGSQKALSSDAEAVAGGQKWYAHVTLQQPRGATCVRGGTVTQVNTVSYRPDSFACFHIYLSRVNPVYMQREFIECGWFQNRSGFYLFGGRSTLAEGYHEEVAWQFNASEAESRILFSLCIGQSGSDPSRYRAWQRLTVVPPGILSQDPEAAPTDEYVRLMEINFTIAGENLYLAGAESNDDHNTLEGWFKNLEYWQDAEWHIWSTVEAYADPPYSVETVSTSEFYTHGGYPVGDINHDGIVNYMDLFLFRKAYNGAYNPCADLDGDGDVDYADLYLLRQCYIAG